DDGRKALG
ncbi:hypothetical protein N499_0610B, partial [Wolbachia pipientis wVitA]